MGDNGFRITGSDTGQPVEIRSEGIDENISIVLSPKGTGQVQSAKDCAFGGGYRQTIDGWYLENAGAGLNNQVLTRLSGTTNNPTGWIAPRAGSVTGIAVHSNAARTAGTLTLRVFRNGTQLGTLGATLDGSATTFRAVYQEKDVATFQAGDILDVRVSTDATWAPTTGDIRGILEVET